MTEIFVVCVAPSTWCDTTGAVDAEVTLTVSRTADLWWAWHDADSSRWHSTEEAAQAACSAWLCGESSDGPSVDIEGEVTLVPSEYDGRLDSWGDLSHWASESLHGLDSEMLIEVVAAVREAAASL